MKIRFIWHTYRYLPYEYTLARRELEALFGQSPIDEPDGLSLHLDGEWEARACRTTYFREVFAENGQRIVPVQAQLEASTQSELQLSFPSEPVAPSLRRQSTRYSAHGIHEYRGKFHPQIVRTIGNMLELEKGTWILDPFCGSGTTLLEAVHNQWNAIGVDINPLSILIAQAKLATLRIPSPDLTEASKRISQHLLEKASKITYSETFSANQAKWIAGSNWQSHLPNIDYLNAWFTESVLVQISAILQAIAQHESCDIQTVFRVVLSDILRSVSLQDPDDLRIRRRKTIMTNAPAIPLFLEGLESKLELISRSRHFLLEQPTSGEAILGDSRTKLDGVRAFCPYQRFDAIITSPPYINALPYIDTHRLSLAVLGLIDARAIKATEKSLIGNREISSKERTALEEDMQYNADKLPRQCITLCRTLYDAVDQTRDGFRRQNVPGLAYQYCRDMALMFEQVMPLLKSRSQFALVVGSNKTVLGGEEFIIDTPGLLAELAEHKGFAIQEIVETNTYHRYDVHQANSIRSEAILILMKP
jgi:site-specific DNA-methyltransferase (cytosine-N4-specific)